jgi:predicted aldo/keto reductase-like oxidoreductase
MDRILEAMLRRLSTDRIDFLLAHALNDYGAWERTVSLGYLDFLAEAKQAGKIRFAGFSWHGKLEEFKKVVDDYPWDFCQIQYNYLDENFQAGTAGLEYAAGKGLGVAVMEPLRGGSLVGRMPRSVAGIMDGAAAKRSPAAWALDWVWDRPEVSVVLSGLNDERHIEENLALAAASAPGSFGPEERKLIARVRDEYRRLLKVGCTGCAYCLPCPSGVDIPNVFSMRNNLHLFGNGRCASSTPCSPPASEAVNPPEPPPAAAAGPARRNALSACRSEACSRKRSGSCRCPC